MRDTGRAANILPVGGEGYGSESEVVGDIQAPRRRVSRGDARRRLETRLKVPSFLFNLRQAKEVPEWTSIFEIYVLILYVKLFIPKLP